MNTRITSIILLLCCSAGMAFSQDIFIDKDTSISQTWNIPAGTILKFGSRGHISGNGTIKGGIIDAAMGQWIFDTSITIFPEGTYGRDFSARWYGAGRMKDNAAALQKGINTVIANYGALRDFFIPKGSYSFSRPITVANFSGGKYRAAIIHIYGESSFWDAGGGTSLLYTGTDGFALGLQLNKGTEINNLTIKGQFKSPEGPATEFYNTPFEKYRDADGKCTEQYAGIVIDYDGSKNASGSTGVKVHDVTVGNFSIDFLVSPNGKTANADILVFENLHCGDAKVAFATGQAQEKGNIIRGIYSWGSIHTLFSAGRYGRGESGNYIIDGGNVAGRCIRLFDIVQGGRYSTTVYNIFSEAIGSIGNISSGIPLSINNCTFHFAFPEQAGKQVLFSGDNPKFAFNTCIFRYYGRSDPMKFKGQATYNNCIFSGQQEKE